MDSVEAELRLDWAEQELEAKSALVADLQHHLNHVSSENVDLRARVDTLKSVQETLLSDKLAAGAASPRRRRRSGWRRGARGTCLCRGRCRPFDEMRMGGSAEKKGAKIGSGC